METPYARQLVIDAIGQAGQQRLARARVVCVGAGGLGSAALLALVGAGVADAEFDDAPGWIRIVDADVLEITNLNRQFLYSRSALGKPKVELAARRLRQLNPNALLQVHHTNFGPHNASQLLAGAQLVVDCTDNLPTRLCLNHWCYHLGLPLVSASISRFAGVLACFDGHTAPCLACVSRFADQGADCAVDGIVGAVAQAFGSLLANEAIKTLACGTSLAPRLWLLDCLHLDATSLGVAPNPGCQVCGSKRTAPDDEQLEIAWQDVSPDWLLVDVRSQTGTNQLPASRAIAAAHLEANLPALLPEVHKGAAKLVLVCRRGTQSLGLTKRLRQRYPGVQVYSLRGGVGSIKK